MTKILDYSEFKARLQQSLDPVGERPLHIGDGIISGQPRPDGDRLTRIRGSLDRINKLMAELKRISDEVGDKNDK